MGHNCPTCGKELNTEQGVKLHHSKVHDKSLPNCVCSICGDEFYHPSSDRSRCEDHRGQSGELNGNYRAAKQEDKCENCGEVFRYYPSEKPGMYCDRCAEVRAWMNDGVKYQYDKPIGPEPYTVGHGVGVKTRVDGYEMIDRQYKGERVAIPHHRLLAVAKYGISAVEGMDVHHKNGIRWDNRPENIELLTRSEHARIHNRQ